MFYDFHIHSALSPCANDEMTPNNIVNMALIKGLNAIAVSDHNSCKQQSVVATLARKAGLKYYYGVEVQSKEEVHILCYFLLEEEMQQFQTWIEVLLLPIKNDVNYFGHQYLMNDMDEVISEEAILLLQSIAASIDEVCAKAHELHGLVVLAHVLDRSNSITTQLGFIPKSLDYDGIEIKRLSDKMKVLKMHSWISEDGLWLIDSDAHQLMDIAEAEQAISESELMNFWRKRL